jgi:hypothetical protein
MHIYIIVIHYELIADGVKAHGPFQVVVDNELNFSIALASLGHVSVGHFFARYERHALIVHRLMLSPTAAGDKATTAVCAF